MAKLQMSTQIIAGFAASMSLAGAGFGFGWPSPSLPKLLAEDADIYITSGEASWVVSIFAVGSAIGGIVGGTAADICGRKWLLLSTIIPYVISCILIGFAQNVWWYLAGRIISGIGTGMGYAVVPMYAGEIADDRIRGAISGMLDPVVNISVVITYCSGPWVSLRALNIVGGILPLIFGLMFIWMPESPYYLIMKRRPDQAAKSLAWLRRRSDVSEELKMIQDNVESEQKNAGTIRELVMIPGNRKALIIVLGLIIAQQASGLSAVISYSTLIFDAAGTSLDSSISTIIFGVLQTLAGVLIVFIVDLAGRRVLLLLSTIGSTLCLIGLALYFQLQAVGIDVSSIFWLPVTAMFSFIVVCTIGLGALPYVVLSEIFPCNVKGLAMIATNLTGALSSVVVTKVYQIVADAYGIHASLWVFVGLTIFSVIFIYFTLPETKQRSLQDIQDELHKTSESRIMLNKSYP